VSRCISIEYFKNARSKGDELFVIVNNDIQRELKGSKEFQDQNERKFIVKPRKIDM
jgi:D-beta-D-heptose 7-phosphate kinase/D-beta-D-heptose 1-phosphate adenosyltransferase